MRAPRYSILEPRNSNIEHRTSTAQNYLQAAIRAHLALRHWRNYRAGKLTRRELARNVVIESASLLLIFALAHFAGGLVAGFVQENYGWLLGLLSALLVGAAAGLAVHKTLGSWVRGDG